MFSLLRAAFTLLVCVVVVGYFLGWFSFSRSAADPKTNKVNINLSVDKSKMGNDLQRFEQKVSKGIQDLQTPVPSGNPPAGQPAGAPRLSFGPLGMQPPGQADGQLGGPQSPMPGISFGPLSLQPAGASPTAPLAPPPGQPQLRLQTPDYQYTLPLNSPPPPGEGR